MRMYDNYCNNCGKSQKIYTNIDLIIPVPNRWILKKRYLEAKRKESV